jgi:hypothetical protein
MTKPTLAHTPAADGSRITVVTRLDENGALRIEIYRDGRKDQPIMAGEFTARSRWVIEYRPEMEGSRKFELQENGAHRGRFYYLTSARETARDLGATSEPAVIGLPNGYTED